MSYNPTLCEALVVLAVTKLKGDAEAEKTINAAIQAIIEETEEREQVEEYAGPLREAAERMVRTYRDWMAGADETRANDVMAAHIHLRDTLAVVSRVEQKLEGVTLTGAMVKDALEFVAPDGDADQLETEIVIAWCPARTSSEGEPMAAGYFAWMADYPEEGCVPLGSPVIAPEVPRHAASCLSWRSLPCNCRVEPPKEREL